VDMGLCTTGPQLSRRSAKARFHRDKLEGGKMELLPYID
jgi:hypothetical protein